MTQTDYLHLNKPADSDAINISVLNENSDRIDEFAGNINEEVARKANSTDLAAVATSGSYADLSNVPEIDAAPTESSTNAVQSGGVHTALGTKMPLGLGTALGDDADLFTLPVGKYYRSSAPVATMSNVPSDVTTAFYCEIVNTISTIRRKIFLYPCTAATSNAFYTCLETSVGYGTWYKFTGEAVT